MLILKKNTKDKSHGRIYLKWIITKNIIEIKLNLKFKGLFFFYYFIKLSNNNWFFISVVPKNSIALHIEQTIAFILILLCPDLKF